MTNQKYEIPSILYEEPQQGRKANPIPYIEVAKDKTMPPVLWVFEYKETGEEDIGPDGEPAKVVEQIPHQYCDMNLLKEKLPGHLFDMVRTLIGMDPLKKAQEKGQKILDKVNENLEKNKKDISTAKKKN